MAFLQNYRCVGFSCLFVAIEWSFDIFWNIDRIEVRIVTKYFVLKGLTTTGIHKELDSTLKDSSIWRKSHDYSFLEFLRCGTYRLSIGPVLRFNTGPFRLNVHILLHFEVFPHAPYSPDLIPSDYFLFPNLKNWFAGRRFTSNDDVKAETTGYFAEWNKSHYTKGIKKMKSLVVLNCKENKKIVKILLCEAENLSNHPRILKPSEIFNKLPIKFQ